MIIKITAYMKKAGIADLFADGKLKPNATVFLGERGRIKGHVSLQGDESYKHGMLAGWREYAYVLQPTAEIHQDTLMVSLYLRSAELMDFVYSNFNLKINKPYFVMEGNIIAGPYFIFDDRNLDYYERLAAAGTMFVVHEKQNYKPADAALQKAG